MNYNLLELSRTGHYYQMLQAGVRRLQAAVPCPVSRDVSALHSGIGARVGNWKLETGRSEKDKFSRQSSFPR